MKLRTHLSQTATRNYFTTREPRIRRPSILPTGPGGVDWTYTACAILLFIAGGMCIGLLTL